MAFNTAKDELQKLIQHATNTRHIAQAICGLQHDLTHEILNLYRVLRRLQREVYRDESPLLRLGDTRKNELKSYSEGCAKILDDSNDFLTKYRELCDLKKSILQSEIELPFSAADKEVLNKFRSDLIYYVFQLSQITVKASMDSLGEVKDQIDSAGFTLRFALNTIAARILAENQICISALAEHPKGDTTLWEELHQALIDEGLASSFVKEYRKPILAYIKALERRTAFEGIDPPGNSASNSGFYNKDTNKFSRRDSDATCGTGLSKDSQDGGMPPLSRKRTRSNEEWSRKTSKTNSFESSKEPTTPRGFRFSDPMKVFQTFMEREGAKIADDEILSDFINEKAAYMRVPTDPRDQLREIYRSFCDDYEHRCETLLAQIPGQDNKDIKEYSGLINFIDKRVILELDGIDLGDDDDLRAIRRKIIVKMQRILERLEAAKESGS